MIEFKKSVLDNGMSLIVEHDESTSLAAVNILYKVGSRDESPDKTGFAHLFEHLMFGGTPNAPDFDTPLQMAGGENNAFTNNDYTNFYNVLPAQNIETALWLEADRMTNLAINNNSLEIQKKVVIEEFKEVCLNKPYGESWHHMSDLAYKKHSYRWPTIGLNLSHIEQAHLEDVQSFYERYYNPSNCVLSVSSPISPDKVIEMVSRRFGDIEAGFKQQNQSEIEPPQNEFRYKCVRQNVPSPLVMLSFHMPGRLDDSFYAIDILTELLANGKSSRLYSSLVKEKQLLSFVNCYVTGNIDPGLLVIEARPMPGHSAEDCVAAIWAELERVKREVIPDRELQKLKNKIISSLVMSDVSILNKAISMAYYEGLGRLDIMNSQEELYEKVTGQQLHHTANTLFVKENLCQLDYLPLAGTD